MVAREHYRYIYIYMEFVATSFQSAKDNVIGARYNVTKDAGRLVPVTLSFMLCDRQTGTARR